MLSAETFPRDGYADGLGAANGSFRGRTGRFFLRVVGDAVNQTSAGGETPESYDSPLD